MKKILLFGNEREALTLGKNNFSFDFAPSSSSYIIYKISRVEDFCIAKKLKALLSIKLILVIKSQSSNIVFSKDETLFINSIIKNDLVKFTCIDLKISKSSYYNVLKKMLQKTGQESIEALRYWAILHLSI